MNLENLKNMLLLNILLLVGSQRGRKLHDVPDLPSVEFFLGECCLYELSRRERRSFPLAFAFARRSGTREGPFEERSPQMFSLRGSEIDVGEGDVDPGLERFVEDVDAVGGEDEDAGEVSEACISPSWSRCASIEDEAYSM